MIQAKGYAALSVKAPLTPFAFERRDPKDYDVVIDIKYCGICHSDIHMARNEWGSSMFPMVPGHEIAGVVSAVGSRVSRYKVGDQVGVGCFVDSCRECANCKRDLDQYCLEGNTLTYSSLERDKSSVTQGGYSNVIVVHENYVVRIPNALPLDKAAPLLCAGITLYSPLMHWKAGPGKKVAIMGLGGLGHMGVKIAAALQADVTVLSHSENKREDAMKLGAHHFVGTHYQKVFKDYANTFDLIINTVSADINMNDYFGLLKTDGTLVSVGAPEKPYAISPFPLLMQRRSYAGSAIGSIKETQEMLDFCAKHKITPEIEVITPHSVNEAYERVLKSDVRYRFVMDMARL
ncbi:MAG TPA: NAD(P)-dependent alcohol dehydrogenase [Oligoflexus sp.]|uniref:NAD(P)-dependent alcohol dehydrogenase n=1 Tax=Oligoflexus sp. TaxID=1971216 RepID=UPI002D28596E|nr:NAD(P)-dependent alcohol dehydrogenase [Oligoflexus sp.]HYX38401.1 NAD(P)-dependent alcohol dehydrogenase [Oligoflexus sp.]